MKWDCRGSLAWFWFFNKQVNTLSLSRNVLRQQCLRVLEKCHLGFTRWISRGHTPHTAFLHQETWNMSLADVSKTQHKSPVTLPWMSCCGHGSRFSASSRCPLCVTMHGSLLSVCVVVLDSIHLPCWAMLINVPGVSPNISRHLVKHFLVCARRAEQG